MSAQTWSDVGIQLPPGSVGEIDVLCPRCSHTRKKRTARCLSVNTVSERWYCHHCGWAGALGSNGTTHAAPLRHNATTPTAPRVYTLPKPPLSAPLSEQVTTWFARRGIPASILETAGITAGEEFCPQLGRAVMTIRFPYWRDSRLVNIKYRAASEKVFWMHKGAERVFYGLDDILGAETICLVEGEIDILSIRTASGPPTLSVPDGAPSPDAKHYQSKFTFLYAYSMERLRAATTVLIGTDMDVPGSSSPTSWLGALATPPASGSRGIPTRTPTRCLLAERPQAVLDALAAAEPFPVPPNAAIPDGARPVRLLPPARDRRPIVELPPVEGHHAG